MKTKRCLWMIPLLLLVACGGSEHGHEAPETEHRHEAAPTDPGAAEAAAEALARDLVLDGDQKWQMDEHTRLAVMTMSDRFVGLDPATASPPDLERLGKTLGDDLQSLIQGCTMSGDAHNELHKFLGHYLPAVNRLTTSGDAVNARRVEALLAVYGDYFE